MKNNNLKLSSIIESTPKKRKPMKVILQESQLKNLIQNIKNESKNQTGKG